MAKGNLFLGMGRGKVGDVVFYRQYGEQVTRSRNRSPRNPNSYKQRVQRAIMANISRIYSLGKPIFDHSFEGQRVGPGSQSAFVQRNAKILRDIVIMELRNGTPAADCRGRVGAPGLSIAVPFDGIQISSGSLQQTLFRRDTGTGESPFTSFTLPVAQGDGDTVAQYAARNGMVPGDIYTVVYLGVSNLDSEVAYEAAGNTDMEYGRLYTARFSWVQFKVKDGISTDTTAINAETTFPAFFDIVSSDNIDLSNNEYTDAIEGPMLDETHPYGCLGVIRSREDSGLRSESFAYFTGDSGFGLVPKYIADVWTKVIEQPGSDLILEGSDFQAGEA